MFVEPVSEANDKLIYFSFTWTSFMLLNLPRRPRQATSVPGNHWALSPSPTLPLSPRSPHKEGGKKISWSLEEKLVSSYVSGLPRAANFRCLLLLGITFVTCIGLGREGGRWEG